MWGCAQPAGRRGFSLPELLVVLGIICLLIAILLPPLQRAHHQAMATRCAAQLQQIGLALENARQEYKYYPIWDDGGSPIRYTWIDVLVQRRLLGNCNAAYCPDDPRPANLNSDRGRHYNVLYPGQPNQHGIDYSYGIGVPLASGGWNWRPGFGPPGERRPRRFVDHERQPARRLLAADAVWSTVYNLSGDALYYHSWNYPTRYDNTVAWRHSSERAANLLFQDGHVGRLVYHVAAADPVSTARSFLWYPGEPIHVGPEDRLGENWYPNEPPVNLKGDFTGDLFPREMVPAYYTRYLLWTRIYHK